MTFHQHLKSHWFDKVRVQPRVGAKAMGEAMCQAAGIDPELVRRQAYHGRKGSPEIEKLRIQIAARMISYNLPMADIMQWFEGFSEETIYRWARENKFREGNDA
ncbi:hypothetical protein [Devosia riboflavina]